VLVAHIGAIVGERENGDAMLPLRSRGLRAPRESGLIAGRLSDRLIRHRAPEIAAVRRRISVICPDNSSDVT